MVKGILGKKLGMSQIFDEKGDKIPVTVIEAGPCQVQQVKTAEKDGYNAVQLGFEDTRESRTKKPQREYLKRNKLTPKKVVREIRCDEAPEEKTGDMVTIKLFQKGDYLDISGTSKGKGFQGGMKRCGWAGGKESHGSMSHRVPGSIGASSYPSKVDKGHPGPGHLGNGKVTVQNVEIIDVDTESNLIVVKGAIPGANGNYITIRFAKKKPFAERVIVEEEQQAEEEKAEEPAEAGETASGSVEETQSDGQSEKERSEKGQDEEPEAEKEEPKDGNEEKS